MKNILKTIIIMLILIVKLQGEEIKSLASNKIKMIIDYVKNDTLLMKTLYDWNEVEFNLNNETGNIHIFNKDTIYNYIEKYYNKQLARAYPDNASMKLKNSFNKIIEKIGKRGSKSKQKIPKIIENKKNVKYKLYLDIMNIQFETYNYQYYFVTIKDEKDINSIGIFNYIFYIDIVVNLIAYEYNPFLRLTPGTINGGRW